MPLKKKIFHDSDSESEESHNEEVSDSEETQDLIDSDQANSDDDAPEDVSFSTSRQAALERSKAASEQIGKAREQKKLKRKQIDEQYKEQKRKKQEALKESRLPDDLLATLSSKPVATAESGVTNDQEKDSEEDASHDDIDADIYGEDELEDDYGSGKEDEFIPLESSETGIKAVCLREELRKTLSSAQLAAEFKAKRLFGSSVRREPMHQKLAKKMKRKARFL